VLFVVDIVVGDLSMFFNRRMATLMYPPYTARPATAARPQHSSNHGSSNLQPIVQIIINQAFRNHRRRGRRTTRHNDEGLLLFPERNTATVTISDVMLQVQDEENNASKMMDGVVAPNCGGVHAPTPSCTLSNIMMFGPPSKTTEAPRQKCLSRAANRDSVLRATILIKQSHLIDPY
jgi:hypothetical protein